MISLYFAKTQNAFTHVVFLFFLLFLSAKADAQCPPGDVTLNTQAQIGQFLVDYPNCTQITGQLTITGNTTDLSPLNGLTHITRALVISGTELTDINGLTGLVSVGNFIQIGGENAPGNPQLQNISGLNNLISVGGGIIIIKNPSLTGITGFNALAQVGGAFDVRQNANLTNIEGFVNLITIGGYSYINDTKAVSIAGLSNLQNIGSFLILDNNANLISTSFLSNLTTVGGGMAIRNNAQLQSLNGLSKLTSVGGNVLLILNNTVLSDISTLQNVNPATISEQGLIIQNNPALSVCNLPNFCTYLANPAATHPRIISGNLANCADEAAVVAACPRPDCPPGDVRLRSQAEVNQFVADYPNCTEIAGLLRIGEADGSSSDITDISGLSNLRRIGGILFVQNNGVLQNLDGLDNLEHVGGRLYIGHNAQLREINALGKLTGFGGPIVVINNAAIRNLDGLIGIVTMNAFISIDGNAALDDISGIRNIDPNTITELYIQNNPALAVCDLDNVCSYLQSAKPRNISGNLGNCLDETAVVATCNAPQCPPGDILLRSQADVNQFVTNYPNCTEIEGLLQIGEFQGSVSNVTDIRGLSKLTRIAGGLFVQNTGVLQNLDGLNSLASVGGDVYIGNNTQLLHVDGLNSLASVGGFTDINNNTALVNVDGLSSLTSIGKGLFIGYNTALANLDGLRNLSALGGYLRIRDNATLLHLNGLHKITQIGGNIYVYNNTMLNDILGMRNIAPGSIEIEFGLTIQDNPALAVCNLPNFCTYLANDASTHPRNISGNLANCLDEAAVVTACIPSPCPSVGQLSLTTQEQVNQFRANYPNCTELESNLFIGLNDQTSNITDLTPLSNLTHVGGWIAVYSTSLVSLNGLHNLTTVKHDLDIRANANLTDITALQNTTFAPFDGLGLTIVNNPALTVCDLSNFCAYLSNPAATHPRQISGNAGDCISAEAVTNACLVSIDEFDAASFATWPNPVTDILNIIYSKMISSVEVTDIMGKTVMREAAYSNNVQLNMSSLTAGIYLVQVNIGDHVKVVKVMKK